MLNVTKINERWLLIKNGIVLRHKEWGHAAGDHDPSSLLGPYCKQGPHRTLSPSVSCTALGSAARLALPLASAI